MTTAVTSPVAPEPDSRTRPMRARIVAAAARLTTEHGWAAVTMTGLAVDVGVSRQTVYNEIGTKAELAEAIVLEELSCFLNVVEDAFDQHPVAVEAAIRAACRAVFDRAQDSALLRAIVGSSHGADTELLPPLTTRAESLVSAAHAVLAERLTAYDVDLSARRLDTAVDAIVRAVLSHVMMPSGSPATCAREVSWVALRLLGRER